MTLRTHRLELSMATVDDVDAIFEACQDPDIQRYTTVPSPYTRADAVDFVARASQWWESATEATWAIRADGVLTGVVGLHRLGGGDAELGYWMSATHRGRGFLTEAATAVIDWGFSADGLELARIQWRAVVGNLSSARAARALGFHFEGTQRASLRNGSGVRADGWIAGLLPSDDRTPQPWPVLDA